ncbi:MAG: NIPSNAP family protein [Planctomycetaceae bacterium]|nr:NIPSNAP family protein [Planctomycetaceae bacterium]
MIKQFAVALTVSFLALGASLACAAEKASEVYELRTYTTNEGKLPALHKRFSDHTMTIFETHGIKNIAYWTPTDKPNTLVYLVAHKSRAAARKSWPAFGNDPAWKKAYAASTEDGRLVSKVESIYLQPNDYSPVKSGGFKSLADGKNLTYELRTYTTNKGKLKNLNARFRDHTLRIFKKHGMLNVFYATPLDEKRSSNTLVYFIAHKSADAAAASWKAFGGDAEWKKVAKESQVDGRILTKGGVKRQYLKATDYSPVK